MLGWKIVQEKGCQTCHYIVDSGAKQAPELSTVGTKFFNNSGISPPFTTDSKAFHDVRFGYLKESLRCPQANLSKEEAKKCKATLQPAADVSTEKPLSGAELAQEIPLRQLSQF